MVKLVEGQWNRALIDELCAFPNGAHDDQVDAASAAFRSLLRRVTWHVAYHRSNMPLLRSKAERLVLAAPFGWQVGEAGNFFQLSFLTKAAKASA
jgi:hypothetical protein